MTSPQLTALAAADDVFRRAGARVVAALAASLGARHLDLVEDAVQDALVSAMRSWAHGGVPDDPAAWLYRASRNRALDLLRRDRGEASLDEHEGVHVDERWSEPHVHDAELRMVLMCCHPRLSPTSRVALALSVVAGLTAPEIARALVVAEPAARQLLVRAKRRLRDESVELTLPGAADLDERLDATLATIYLMFNEGYCAFDGERLVRRELCREALRICGLLLDSPQTARPRVLALAALLSFQSARLDARTDADGNVIRLADQDRSRYDARLIGLGFELLGRAGEGSTLSIYHLEAEIASHHARATSMAATDWNAIVRAYDALVALNPSPVIALNRVVAIAERDGVNAALADLDALRGVPALESYPFLHTTRGELLRRSGRVAESAAAFAHALALSISQPARRFISARME